MAGGGVAHMAAGGTPSNADLVNQAYANIGRTGVGTNPNQIDQSGYDYWLNQLNSGAVTPADLSKTFGGSVNAYINQSPSDPVSQVAENAMVNQAYSNIGRTGVGTAPNQIDAAGQQYWLNQLQTGAVTPQDFANTFTGSATQSIKDNPTAPVSTYVAMQMARNNAKTLAQTPGGRPLPTDSQFYQPVYTPKYTDMTTIDPMSVSKYGTQGATGVGGGAGMPQMQTPFNPRGPDIDNAMQAAAQQVMPVTPQNFASITGTRTGKLRPDQIPAKAAAGGIASLLRAK